MFGYNNLKTLKRLVNKGSVQIDKEEDGYYVSWTSKYNERRKGLSLDLWMELQGPYKEKNFVQEKRSDGVYNKLKIHDSWITEDRRKQLDLLIPQ